MPFMREFTIQMEDRPGTLGKICRVLADRGVNILAFHSFSPEGKSVVRIIVDNLTTAKTALDTERYTCTETEVALVKLPHRPGELARLLGGSARRASTSTTLTPASNQARMCAWYYLVSRK